MSPVKVSKSKKNRIVSDSEDDSPVKSESKQSFPIFDKSPAKKSITEDSPKKSPPKSLDSSKKSKAEKTPKSEKSSKTEKKSTKKSPKAESPKPSTSKESSPKPSTSADTPKPKPKNPFQNFFSPKSGGGQKENTTAEDGKDYSIKVKKLQYHPVDDAFWKKGEKTPYLALAKTLVAIEETSGRLRTIEMLSNYFRSVIVLNSDDLIASVYMILNR